MPFSSGAMNLLSGNPSLLLSTLHFGARCSNGTKYCVIQRRGSGRTLIICICSGIFLYQYSLSYVLSDRAHSTNITILDRPSVEGCSFHILPCLLGNVTSMYTEYHVCIYLPRVHKLLCRTITCIFLLWMSFHAELGAQKKYWKVILQTTYIGTPHAHATYTEE